MVSAQVLALVALTVVASTTPTIVEAHGRLGMPKPTFIASATTKPNYWAYGVFGDKNPPASDYAGGLGIDKRQANFAKNFEKNGFKSLKEWIMANQVVGNYDGKPSGGTPECGFTDPNGTPQPLSDKLVWPSPTFQHPGPCEAWCDDVIVMPYTPNCKSWESQGNKMTYDKAKCQGKKMLSFYWVATHVVPFQVYPSCVRLLGGGSSSSNSTTGGNTSNKGTTGGNNSKGTTGGNASKGTTGGNTSKDTTAGEASTGSSTKCKRRLDE